MSQDTDFELASHLAWTAHAALLSASRAHEQATSAVPGIGGGDQAAADYAQLITPQLAQRILHAHAEIANLYMQLRISVFRARRRAEAAELNAQEIEAASQADRQSQTLFEVIKVLAQAHGITAAEPVGGGG